MVNCKTCDRKYHACMSCGLIGYEWVFCTERCYIEYKDKYVVPIFKSLIYELEEDDARQILNMLNTTIEENGTDSYMSIVLKELILKELKDE